MHRERLVNSPTSYGSPRSAAFNHGRLTSRPVSYGILSYAVLRSLTVFTPFYYVCHVELRLSRRMKFIDHGDKYLYIGAVTIVNNTDHTLHNAIEEEIQARTFLINPAVGC